MEKPKLLRVYIGSDSSDDYLIVEVPVTYSKARMASYVARVLGCFETELRHLTITMLRYSPSTSFIHCQDDREFIQADEKIYPLMAIKVLIPAWRKKETREAKVTVKIIRERPDGHVVKLPARTFLHEGSGPTLPCLYYLLCKDKTLHPFSVCRVPIGFEYVLSSCTNMPPITIHNPSTWELVPLRIEKSCMYCLDAIPDMVCACPGNHVAVCRDCHFSKEHFCPQCNVPAVMYPISRFICRDLELPKAEISKAEVVTP